jgi:hypothetical protein
MPGNMNQFSQRWGRVVVLSVYVSENFLDCPQGNKRPAVACTLQDVCTFFCRESFSLLFSNKSPVCKGIIL